MRRGFTLVEMLLTLTLMTLLLAMVTLNLRQAPSRAGVRGAAETVAEELRSARQRAQAIGIPCAVALPSSAGSIGFCQSLYHLEGWAQPRVTRVVRLGGDFPQAYLFGGSWGSGAAPGPPPTVNGGAIPWTSPFPGDPTWVFLPSGAVRSTEALVGGSYRVVVCDGLSWASGSPGFVLTGASNAASVALSPLGEIRLEAGPLLGGAPPPAGPPAAPPALAAGPNQPPDRLDLAILPVPNPASLPPGASATVKLDGYLTLEAEASDPDGEPLALEWETTEVTPSGAGGNYSSSGQVEMRWDTARSAWRAEWEWRCPPGASAGDSYLLTATARDPRGGSLSGHFGVTGRVEVLEQGRIIFSSTRDGNWDIYGMNHDGTDVTRLSDSPGLDFRPRWSPDGSKLLFISGRSGRREAYLTERDGSQPRLLTDLPTLGVDEVHFAAFTPDGANVIFIGQTGATNDVYMITLQGTDPRNPGVPGAWRLTSEFWLAGTGEVRGVAPHPDGQRVVVSGGPVTDVDIYEVLYGGVTTPVVTRLISLPFNQMEPSFNLDGSRLTWTSSTTYYTYSAPAAAPGSLGPGGAAPSAETPTWAPDSARMTYQVGPIGARNIVISDLSGGGLQQLTTGADNDDSQWSTR